MSDDSRLEIVRLTIHNDDFPSYLRLLPSYQVFYVQAFRNYSLCGLPEAPPAGHGHVLHLHVDGGVVLICMVAKGGPRFPGF